MGRVKDYNSEVNVICDGKSFMIPLRFLTRQSKKISEVAYAPLDKIVFTGYQVSTIKLVLHFCRSGYVHAKGEERHNLLQFAQQWEMVKLKQWLTRSNQNNSSQQQNLRQEDDEGASTDAGQSSQTNSGFFGFVQRKDSVSSTSTVNSQANSTRYKREFVNSKYSSDSSMKSSISNYPSKTANVKNQNIGRGSIIENKSSKKLESEKMIVKNQGNSDSQSKTAVISKKSTFEAKKEATDDKGKGGEQVVGKFETCPMVSKSEKQKKDSPLSVSQKIVADSKREIPETAVNPVKSTPVQNSTADNPSLPSSTKVGNQPVKTSINPVMAQKIDLQPSCPSIPSLTPPSLRNQQPRNNLFGPRQTYQPVLSSTSSRPVKWENSVHQSTMNTTIQPQMNYYSQPQSTANHSNPTSSSNLNSSRSSDSPSTTSKKKNNRCSIC